MTPVAVPSLRPLMLQRTAGTAVQRTPAVGLLPAAPTAPHDGVEAINPADFAALRQVLETVGHFAPAPPDPLWSDPGRTWLTTMTAGWRCWRPLIATTGRIPTASTAR